MESPEAKPVAVIGAGSWGTTLAQLLGEKGKDVRLWVREAEVWRTAPGPDQPYLSPGGPPLLPPQLHPGISRGPGGRRCGPHGGALPRLPPDLNGLKTPLPAGRGAAQRHQGHGDRLPPHHGRRGPGRAGRGDPLRGAGRTQLRPGSGPEAAHRGDRGLPLAGGRPLHPTTPFGPLFPGLHLPRRHRRRAGRGPEEHLCHRHRHPGPAWAWGTTPGRPSSPGGWRK